MEKNNLLNLLLAGGIAVAIALGGAGLGVALNKSKSEESTSSAESGILGLYGGYKTLTAAEIKTAKQEILEIEVDASKTDVNDKAKVIEAKAEEVKILDLSKTIGDLKWILKQLKYHNIYSNKIGLKELKATDWKQKITFNIKEKLVTNIFDSKKVGIFAVEAKVAYTAAVEEDKDVVAVAESWKVVYSLDASSDDTDGVAGVVGTVIVANTNSKVFKDGIALAKLAASDFQVIYWKNSGDANVDGSDAELAVILNKKTGEVFVWAKPKIEITERIVTVISKPTVTL